MGLGDTLSSEVQTILNTTWDTRKGTVVPSTANVKLAGGAVELDATFLYADMRNSSKMAKELDRRIAAKILKSFLATSARVIKHYGGTIVSFDGDRILGVFVGSSKNTSAAKCAMGINYVVSKVIRPKFEKNYTTVRDAGFKIQHGVGVDTGTVIAVRAGAVGANDLIWIGRAPNLAAKLSDLRKAPYCTYITASVYNKLHKSAKVSSEDKNMWECQTWNFLGESKSVYRSNYNWKP